MKNIINVYSQGQKVFASLILLTLFFYTAAPAFAAQTGTITPPVSQPAKIAPIKVSSPKVPVQEDSQGDLSPMNIGDSPVTQAFSSPREQLPDIDKNTGALTYSYPITIPPGRNKLQPDLSIGYNSQDAQSNGVF